MPSAKTPSAKTPSAKTPATATPRARKATAKPTKPVRPQATADKATAAPAAKPAAAPKVDKPSKKPAKPQPKLVRDGFTMPGPDFALIAALKSRALADGRETKKSEVLRAGLRVLAALDQTALLAALNQLEPVKIGRPKKGHGSD